MEVNYNRDKTTKNNKFYIKWTITYKIYSVTEISFEKYLFISQDLPNLVFDLLELIIFQACINYIKIIK